jgi:CheY-like chemotaxis protein
VAALGRRERLTAADRGQIYDLYNEAMAGVVIGIANTSDDIIELLRLGFERAGWTAATVHLPDVKAGRASFEDFLRLHDPAGLVFDISPPYDDNWRFVKQLRSLPAMRGRSVVITTTNVRHLARLSGEETGAIEIVGKPNDIQEVVDAMRRVLAK